MNCKNCGFNNRQDYVCCENCGIILLKDVLPTKTATTTTEQFNSDELEGVRQALKFVLAEARANSIKTPNYDVLLNKVIRIQNATRADEARTIAAADLLLQPKI